MQIKTTILVASALALVSCGPKFSAPGSPSTACKNISKAQFDAAIDAGATRATASINAGGTVSMNTGMGTKQCSSFKGSKQICRRPNDFVIQYKLANDQIRYVLVPKESEYRLNTNRKPVPCETINK
jgi:hypothetical protein